MSATSSQSEAAPSMTAAPNVIDLQRLSCVFGSGGSRFAALRDLTLALPAGSSVMLLGENGAGKSTLLKVLAGLLAPTHGTAEVLGLSPRQRRGQIAYMSHQTMLYDELTGPENLAYFVSLEHPGLPREAIQKRAEDALRQVNLDPANTRRVGEYSQGMRQRASLARVLLADPLLLLLDEPFSNLDTASSAAMLSRLRLFLEQTAEHGLRRTLLLTTHQPDLARALARTVVTLRQGRLASIEEIEQAVA